MDSLFLTGYPILKQKFLEILDYIEAGENLTTLWMPMSSRSEFATQLQTKSALPEQLSKKIEFIYLDMSLKREFLERQLEESLSRYSTESGTRNKLIQMVASGKRVVLILDNFSLENADWAKYILSLRLECPPKTVTFLLLSYESEFYAHKTNLTDFSLIYQNLVKVPYFTLEETRACVREKAQEAGYEFTDQEVETISQFCGGVFGIIMNFFRTYRRLKDIDGALRGEQMQNSLQHIWGRFSERERHIIKSIVTLGKVPPYTFELNYMKVHNMLTADNKIFGEWVKVVVGVTTEETLEILGDHITWNGVELGEIFTPQELKVFLALLKAESLDREGVGEILWGAKSDKYSDWAIDQMMSRIRKKLETAGLGEDKIKTLKGKGFKIENVVVTTG